MALVSSQFTVFQSALIMLLTHSVQLQITCGQIYTVFQLNTYTTFEFVTCACVCLKGLGHKMHFFEGLLYNIKELRVLSVHAPTVFTILSTCCINNKIKVQLAPFEITDFENAFSNPLQRPYSKNWKAYEDLENHQRAHKKYRTD